MIRKAFFGTLAALALSATLVSGVGAAPRQAQAGPFEGTFTGTVYGAGGSSAPLTVKATHRGTTVEGVATLGKGLTVQTAWCGAAEAPASARRLSGSTTPERPRHIEATQSFDAAGVTLTARFVGDASADGKTIDGNVIVDVPPICGPDPTITGSLSRVS
ncbi:MAG: hypothetical protein HGA45_04610 [Chloroflexales bacterium]|nr:hypothetical protein [Chloroflexales bacterium]